jgi:hypothetical protein
LAATDCGKLADNALHEFIDELQLELVHIHHAIDGNWFNPVQK